MKKKRSLILRLLPWLIILAAIAALIIFVFVPIYSQQETSFGADPVVYEYEGKNDPLKMETDRLLFEMDPATTQFALTPNSLYPLGDSKALAERIDWWIENREEHDRMSLEYAESAKKFNVEDSVGRIIEMYESAIKGE